MKLLSIAIPCYNSEGYMRNCIESLLPGGDNVEILIVDDGSVKDNTAAIADEYEKNYPGIVRAIHQENKGHGGAVNTGIEKATGLYFKVVDSDDHVDLKAYMKILETLKGLLEKGIVTDVLFSNFVYDKEGAKHKRTMRYPFVFPKHGLFTWAHMGVLGPTQYVLMHSIIYRTGLLRECGLKLPEHCFYVDNIYAFEPFLKVKNMYYLDVDFYRYYIGRADQSVNEQVMLGRLDQQLHVNELMIDFISEHYKELNGRKKAYMCHYLGIIMAVSSVLIIRSKNPEYIQKRNELWHRLKRECPPIYRRIRYDLTGLVSNVENKTARDIVNAIYVVAQKLFGFN